jgi:hypothetical protein
MSKPTITGYTLKVINESMGVLINETFMDQIQFKLFLKAIHGSIELGHDLSFYNGDVFLVHIPNKILLNSVIISNVDEISMTDQVKSRIESLVTK